MIRYGFNIRTRHGQRVENILIMAATQSDAERRLRQMYHQCVIVDCQTQSVPRRFEPLDVDSVIGLISAGLSVPKGRPEELTAPSGGSERSERGGSFLLQKAGTQ